MMKITVKLDACATPPNRHHRAHRPGAARKPAGNVSHVTPAATAASRTPPTLTNSGTSSAPTIPEAWKSAASHRSAVSAPGLSPRDPRRGQCAPKPAGTDPGGQGSHSENRQDAGRPAPADYHGDRGGGESDHHRPDVHHGGVDARHQVPAGFRVLLRDDERDHHVGDRDGQRECAPGHADQRDCCRHAGCEAKQRNGREQPDQTGTGVQASSHLPGDRCNRCDQPAQQSSRQHDSGRHKEHAVLQVRRNVLLLLMTGGNKKIRHSSKIIAPLAGPAPARPAPDARVTRWRAAVHMPRWHRFSARTGRFRC